MSESPGKAVFLSYASPAVATLWRGKQDAEAAQRNCEALRTKGVEGPIYDPVRHDPRQVKLMADAGLTEAHARAQAGRQAHPPEKPAAR